MNHESTTIDCPICGDQRLAGSRTLHDDRFGFPGEFRLVTCVACGHKHLQGFDAASLADLYTRYYPRATRRIEDFRPYRKPNPLVGWVNGGLSSAFRWVPPNVRVLDIGCGFGETLAYHKQRGCDAWGVEADENVKPFAEAFGANIRIGLFDPVDFHPESFDYVTMDQVIEHVLDPVSTLRDVGRVLKSGGSCVLSTPNAGGWGAQLFGQRWINWHVPYHLHFCSRASIAQVATAAGFKVAWIRTITRSEWINYQLLHLIHYPSQGMASELWAPRGRAGAVARAASSAVRAGHYLFVDHLVTRVFDRIGLGDNFVILLKKN